MYKTLILALLLTVSAPVLAQEMMGTDTGASSMTLVTTGKIETVIDPRIMRLNDGHLVTLAGIEIPGSGDSPPSAIAVSAFNLIKKTTPDITFNFMQAFNQTITTDRYGHMLALAVNANTQETLQEKLLSAGLARVWDGDDTGIDLGPLLHAEDTARRNKIGIWRAKSEMGVFTPETLPITALDHITHVIGTITSITNADNDVLLALTDKGISGLFIRIPNPARQGLLTAGIDPMAMNGHTIYARGIVRLKNNVPYLDIIRPWQIQDANLLGEKAKEAANAATTEPKAGAPKMATKPPPPPASVDPHTLEQLKKEEIHLTN